MSSYRDDTVETAVASSSTWGGQHTLVGETARAADEVFYTLGMLVAEVASASDEVIERRAYLTVETAAANDEVADHLNASLLVTETALIRESVHERLRGAVIIEAAVASDEVIDSLMVLITETSTASDSVIDARRSSSLVVETARALDFAFQAARILIAESATSSDQVISSARKATSVSETATASDLVTDSRSASVQWISEQARVADHILDHLHAIQMVIEEADALDAVIQDGSGAQAWTANTRTWAMSRYSPFAFTSMVCIDGVLYASNDSGVYRMGPSDDVIDAVLTTGKLDIGQGILVHPTNAFVEYELDGTAELSVSQTQSGIKETYAYRLESEPAEEQTNGRFKFGKGLRGRHFSFSLRLTGKQAYINDMSVETAPTKRRI